MDMEPRLDSVDGENLPIIRAGRNAVRRNNLSFDTDD